MADRWYVPLVVASGVLMALMVTGLAVVEVLTASAVNEMAPIRWQAPLERMDEALARGDVAAARDRWRQAQHAALRSRQWEALIEIGDGYRRLGRASGAERTAEPVAREAYLAALLAARRDTSLDGVLRAGEAFAELGDHAVVEQCLRVARDLAAYDIDPVAPQRVKQFADRWAARSLEVERGRALGRP